MNRIFGTCALLSLLVTACTPALPSVQATPVPASPGRTATPSILSDQELASKLDTFMRGLEENLSFSGSVLVAREGKVLLSKGYGYADRQQRILNTDQTKFRIASITKQFTAVAILMLEVQGKLDVQDRVCVHLPDCPAAWQPITLHQLLTHTSGIVEYKDLPDYQTLRETPAAPSELLARFADQPLGFEPGGKWGYSNSGYVVLGSIIEHVSGMTYEAFIAENILTRLKMTGTGLSHTPQDLALGYENSFTLTPAVAADRSIDYAAGGMYSTVGDLYRWDQALFTDQMLPKDLRDKMFTAYESMPDSGGLSYGYGHQIGNMDGHRLVGHSGLLEGYGSMNAYYPDDQVAVILLSNERNPPASGIEIQLAYMVLKPGH